MMRKLPSAVPPDPLRSDVEEVLILVASDRGITVDSLSSLDLQSIGYGFRIAAESSDDPDRLFAVADALDRLSEMDKAALVYLENVARSASASA